MGRANVDHRDHESGAFQHTSSGEAQALSLRDADSSCLLRTGKGQTMVGPHAASQELPARRKPLYFLSERKAD